MKTFLDGLLRDADGGGAGGAAAASDAAAAASPPAAAADGSTAAPSPSGDAAAGGTGASPAASDLYRPEGLADHYLGATNNETIDKLKKTVDGYRERDASNQVPDKVEAYSEFGEISDDIKPHLETLKADPLYGRMANFAMENRIPKPIYQGMVTQFLSAGAEMGLLEPPVDEAKEKLELVPEASRHLPEAEQRVAREKRMTENYAFIDAAITDDPATKGGIDKDTADFVKAMLGDTGRGHRFIEYVKSIRGGSQQVYMGGNNPNAGDPKEDLRVRGELAKNTVGHKDFDRASWDQLQADYRKVYGS